MQRIDEKEKKKNGTKLTRQEFRKYCKSLGTEIPANTLRSHVLRKKVIESEEGLIDIEHPQNQKYIQERTVYDEQMANGLGSIINHQKKEIELAKAKESLRMAELQRMKLEGELIEYDKAKIIFKSHMREVYQQLYYACEQIAKDTIHRLGGNQNDIAEMSESLVAILNDQIKKARESSAAKLEEIRSEYKSLNDAKRR